MIKGAEDAGQIQPGKTTLVEPTSGQSSLCALQGILMFDKPEVGLLEAHEHRGRALRLRRPHSRALANAW